MTPKPKRRRLVRIQTLVPHETAAALAREAKRTGVSLSRFTASVLSDAICPLFHQREEPRDA